ncbi:MAG: two-component regulator propeller domain-containing protein [Candidatus Thiodiazotropha endolucinida]|nr:regulator [Candidatus Thiodiazotropha taylori]MCG8095946.1 regulator [Candidatus Thiodiazotropha endolucinida]MCG7953360.1 regulator [Candidatus Thiodiazotropha taylori]MCG8045235.1 regulator [Candidatus Thiodiazotropha taylori]MCG8060693.1 regulator [Candidatus Thiodiazotropha taylori]
MNRSSKIQVTSILTFLFFGMTAISAADSESDIGDRLSIENPTSHGNIEVLERYEIGQSVYARALTVETGTNSLWVGTSAGVHEIDLRDQSIRNTFTREHGLANEYVFAIGIDQAGYKWFGTNSGGMSRYRDGKWKTWFPMHGLADYWVYAFAWQPDGTQWIGTWAGANSLDPATGEMKTYLSELVNEWVYGIAVDSKNRVWFGTEGGISRFDGKDWVSWDHADGLGEKNSDKKPFSRNTGLGTRSRHDLGVLSGGEATYNPNYVFSVLIDQQDNLWAGTWGGGLAWFNGEQWHNYTIDDGLAGDIVYSIAMEPSGVLWIGTNNGLSRFDGNEWTTFGRNDGFSDLNVYAVVVTPNGEIWAGTKGAVVRLGINKGDG